MYWIMIPSTVVGGLLGLPAPPPSHLELPPSKTHHPLSSSDVIDLLRFHVHMQEGACPHWHLCLCKALIHIAMGTGVHELPDDGPVFGCVGSDVIVTCMH